MTSPATSRLVCAGCGAEVPAERPITWACPAARPGDDIDHVLRRVARSGRARASPTPSPVPTPSCATAVGSTPTTWPAPPAGATQRYVDLVSRLDEAVAEVDGRGFRATPIVRSAELDSELGFRRAGGVWVKDETGNVSGSHKARHLMGVMLALEVAESIGTADPDAPLAIASCGNAALAAAVVARAAQRRLVVFVPPTAEPEVVDRLQSLGVRAGGLRTAARPVR